MNVQVRDFRHAILFSFMAAGVFAENAEKPAPPVDPAQVDEAIAKGDPAILKLVRETRATPLSHTYGTAIRAQAFERFDAVKLAADIAQCAQFIIDNQGKNGYWGYSTTVHLPPLPLLDLTPPKAVPAGAAAPKPAGSRGRKMVINRRGWGQFNDNSNTQYAVLGLAACMAAGIYPSDDTLPLVEKWLIDCQNDNYYWIYAIERDGSFTGTALFGKHPWYSEGVAYLLGQQNPDGSWAKNAEGQKILDTCWAILFLKQASKHYCE